MKPAIQPVKGTRDFYPERMAVRNFIYQRARTVSESFGYQEYEGPLLEPYELYAAKSGEELVDQQSFVFPDRGGDLITLRPELTPTLARMVAQRQKQLIYPLRWWSWGPFWRYERPQKGRTREFFQWNIDLIGVDSPEADAEIVAIAAKFLQECGLSANQVNILVNNRKLMELKINQLGIDAENNTEVFNIIDRRDRMDETNWEAYATEIGLNSQQLDGLKDILSDSNLWQESAELTRFFSVLKSLEVEEYIRFAPQIIRGLDYYTGTVFEVWDKDGEFRAILGGGRYDNLVADVGGDPLPATGFAMGDLVISLVLEKFNCLPEDAGRSPAPILVTVFDEDSFNVSFQLAARLRNSNLNVICYPAATKLSRQFKFGDRLGIRVALIVGPDEQENDTVSLKDLATGNQETVPIGKLVQSIQNILDGTFSS